MATLVLAAAGTAIGGALGGSVAGLSAAAVGRAAGAFAGSLIDQRLLGAGAQAVDTGRVERFRVMGAREGAPIPRVFGRMRVAGEVIWASRFLERVDETRSGGKGAPRATAREHRYSVSLALALCEGPAEGVGRIWADGRELATADLSLRFHSGASDQRPDPLIEAIEGAAEAPAYRGLAYVVIEDLPLAPFGNRVPQLHVEVYRRPKVDPSVSAEIGPPLSEIVRGVALSPGSGEFSLATVPVRRRLGPGRYAAENLNSAEARPDLLVALDQLEERLPACRSVSLIVSWFGSDLRCGRCEIAPAVEAADKATEPFAWSVAGVDRGSARVVGRDAGGRPVFGGAPSDQTVMQAIRELRARGLRVMFYPFVLMDVPPGSGLPDPYGAAEQAAYPWRGRITLDVAPGRPGSADRTAAAGAEVAAFFGSAQASDFAVAPDAVAYSGPGEWRFNRFVLHYAALCAAAGGVEAFCVGSELRGLTTLRDGPERFPAVAKLRDLAREARALLGSETKIGYAADWSEYSGHRPADGTGDVFFHLDPLWADPEIDFVGVDNYLPLSDWRDGTDHLDAAEAGSIHSLAYLKRGVEGGEHFDWYYADAAAREAQARTPIRDAAHGEDWVFRVKDLRAWWASPHHDRPGGVRRTEPTPWIPMSKPVWFTELGCPAVDKGANQPNVFVDPKSSESALPWGSTGAADAEIQRRYLQATLDYWAEPGRNPVSPVYGGPMIDLDAAHVWTWDARPWPDFPRRLDVWSDGENHRLGHWITGRAAGAGLAETVAEICVEAGVRAVDVDALHGVVDGYWLEDVSTGRQALQPLMLTFGFDAVESGERLRFVPRDGAPVARVAGSDLRAPEGEAPGGVLIAREAAGDGAAAVRVAHLAGDAAYEPAAAEARLGDALAGRIETVSLPLALDAEAAQATADRWIVEAAAAGEEARMTLPRALLALEPGDVIEAEGAGALRIDRVTEAEGREVVARRSDAALHAPRPAASRGRAPSSAAAAPAPLATTLLDLPAGPGLGAGGLHVAAFGAPWPGAVGVWRSGDREDWRRVAVLERPAVMGELVEAAPPAAPWRWDRGAGLLVRLWGGGLAAPGRARTLDGAGAAAIETVSGDWEILQFADADLVGPDLWRLRLLLRGQAGTEFLLPSPSPAGARFVLLDQALARIGGDREDIGLERRWRIGALARGPGHEACVETVAASRGTALRPMAPARLTAIETAEGCRLRWLRRDPRDSDGWGAALDAAAPSGTLWRVTVRKDGSARRVFETSAAEALYAAADRAADGVAPPWRAAVAELAPGYGPGPETEITIHG